MFDLPIFAFSFDFLPFLKFNYIITRFFLLSILFLNFFIFFYIDLSKKFFLDLTGATG